MITMNHRRFTLTATLLAAVVMACKRHACGFPRQGDTRTHASAPKQHGCLSTDSLGRSAAGNYWR
jgi:hypothetical protein